MADRADSERYMNMARRWFTEGWAGNIAQADDLFSEGRQNQWGPSRRGRT
jgi:hypothetical protein